MGIPEAVAVSGDLLGRGSLCDDIRRGVGNVRSSCLGLLSTKLGLGSL